MDSSGREHCPSWAAAVEALLGPEKKMNMEMKKALK